MAKEEKLFRQWTTQMFEAFKEAYPSVMLNGHPTKRLAHNLNVCFPGIESKALIHLLKDDLSISAGSACTTINVEPSHVLLAIGRSESQSHTAVRIGLGRFTNQYEIDCSIQSIIQKCKNLKKM
jgi:cysteine desulfurase